jgi:hypothetical protein
MTVLTPKLAQEVGAGVVDHEEVGALRVVGAARGPADHVQVRLGHDRLVIPRSGMVRPVHPVSGVRDSDDVQLIESASMELPRLTRCVRRCQIDVSSGRSLRASSPGFLILQP